LTFPERENSSFFDKDRIVVCLLCEDVFNYPTEKVDFLRHLTLEHRFIIGSVEMVSDLPSYIAYWRNKYSLPKVKITDYCTVIRTKMEGETEETDYFLLSDNLTEDKELRMHLQLKRLEHVVAVQEKERNNANFRRNCFFCRTVFDGNHAKLLDHMAFDHNFSVGKPHNLVYVEELLDILEDKLNCLVCIYCEKVFKSREVLKEHMRKKNHKKINPRNERYDKFYMINYLEMGESWKQDRRARDNEDKPFEDEDLPSGFDSDKSDSEENDWSDWRGNLSGAVCLFCPATYADFSDILDHMNLVHEFDYKSTKNQMRLNFYQQIKLINYIRRQIYLKHCISCDEKFDNSEGLMNHMKEQNHLRPPAEKDSWDQSQFFFPTYENDNFLCLIEDDDGIEKDEEEAPVIPQEMPLHDALIDQIEDKNSL